MTRQEHIPRVSILVEAELKVEMDHLVVRGVRRCVVEGLEVRVVDRVPLIHDVELGERLRRVHDEIAGIVEPPSQLSSRVGPIAVDVEGDQEGEISIVPVNGRDQDVVPLGRRNPDLVSLLLLDVCRVVRDDAHSVRVKVEHSGCKGGIVDDADAVRLAFDKVHACSLSFVDKNAVWKGRQKLRIGCREHALHQRDAVVVVPTNRT